MHPEWTMLHPRMSYDQLGYIPGFLLDTDPRSASEQFGKNYVSGWRPFPGFAFDKNTLTLSYPQDPPMQPLARTRLRDEVIYYYPYSWVLVLQPDGSWETSRMD